MKQLAISLVAAFLVGCPSPLGTPCTTDCPSGYLCVTAEAVLDSTGLFYRQTRGLCARQCNTGRDCGPGINCDRGLDRFNQDPGYCNEFGSASEGEMCTSEPPSVESCGPGLRKFTTVYASVQSRVDFSR